ncbi:MAG: alanine--tRNA ligase-related protein [Candidatus Moduliflexus flocculans]|nr:alanine--tRNA ligase-related protein [Candidatus Moduliflexus flocculans]
MTTRYLLEFEAEVVERREHEGRPAVVLDRTAFYPESGGQPWDKGTLGGAKVAAVLDLDGAILHVVEGAGSRGPRPRLGRPDDAARPHAAAHGPARPVAGLLGAPQGRDPVLPHGSRASRPSRSA